MRACKHTLRVLYVLFWLGIRTETSPEVRGIRVSPTACTDLLSQGESLLQIFIFQKRNVYSLCATLVCFTERTQPAYIISRNNRAILTTVLFSQITNNIH